jgi:TolA-binding protein
VKKFVIFTVFVFAFFYLVADFVKTGKLQKFIDDNSDKTWAPKVQYQLGEVYQTFSRNAAAELCFSRVLEKYTSSQITVDSMCQLGAIYEETKRFQDARDIYKRILDEHPDYENKNMIETRLNLLSN